MIEPLHLHLDAACSVEHAFSVWTSGIGSWWPADHTVSGEAGLMLPHYVVTVDGTQPSIGDSP